MPDASTIMGQMAEQRGWDVCTQLELALEYISNQGSDDAFADFLAEHAADADEVEAQTKDDGRSEDVVTDVAVLDWRASDEETEFRALPEIHRRPWKAKALLNAAGIHTVLTPEGGCVDESVSVFVEIDRGAVRVHVGPEGGDGFFGSTVTAERCAIEPTGALAVIVEPGQPTHTVPPREVEEIMEQKPPLGERVLDEATAREYEERTR
jgi:hypothetical protein